VDHLKNEQGCDWIVARGVRVERCRPSVEPGATQRDAVSAHTKRTQSPMSCVVDTSNHDIRGVVTTDTANQ
jgi:hypothetical protein